MLVVVCCPLCEEEGETSGTPGLASTVMVVCPRCGHVFDLALPMTEDERFEA